MLWLIWVSAALSMTLGNVGALVQNNVKRLLAYSSIAHAGYLLVAFAAAPQLGTSAAMFYTAAYATMNLGAFAVVSHFANAGERYVTLEDYEGLGRSSPLLAATLTVFLLSLIGIPMTGGFFAKFYVFSAAVKADLIWLTIIGVLNSGIGAYYYLRIIVMMYMRESRKEVPVTPVAVCSESGHCSMHRGHALSRNVSGICAAVRSRLGAAVRPDDTPRGFFLPARCNRSRNAVVFSNSPQRI